MKYVQYLALVCLLASSQLALSVENAEHKYSSKDQIAFTRPSMAAFDHSGALVVHSVKADGSKVADHNGSMGNVTVARMGPDGKVETYCTTDAKSAKAFMAGEFAKRSAAALHSTVMEQRP